MANRQTVKNRVVKDNEKLKGAAQFFQQEEDNNLPNTVTQPNTDTAEETGVAEVVVTETITGTVNNMDTVTVTGTSPLIKPADIYVRKVCYLLEHQAKYVVKMAKKYKVKEAEIMRIAIEELIKSGKI